MSTTNVHSLCMSEIPEEDFIAAFSELAVLCAVQDSRPRAIAVAQERKLMAVSKQSAPPLRYVRNLKSKQLAGE
jgi:hypothetical protein